MTSQTIIFTHLSFDAPAKKYLREALLGKDGQNLDDLPSMDQCIGTSKIEGVNSMGLKYFSKRYSYR